MCLVLLNTYFVAGHQSTAAASSRQRVSCKGQGQGLAGGRQQPFCRVGQECSAQLLCAHGQEAGLVAHTGTPLSDTSNSF